MLRDNQAFNQSVKANAAFLAELREKLPEFFSADKYDDGGQLIEEGSFDLAKFHQALEENNIKELTSGYRLDFIGKDYAKKQAGEKPTTVILPDREHNSKPENKDSQNLFLTGDNLEVLRHLQTSYENKIDVIYIDPPYNTGSDGFVYPDKFEYSDDSLQAMFGLSDEELKRLKSIQGRASHSAWLTFMYPRLWLAKRLLKDAGVIFVSIDDNEQANLKLLMDEIFGEGSFIQDFLWLVGKGKKDTWSRTTQQYILAYAKSKTDLLPWSEKQFAQGTFSNPDNDPRGEWFSGSISFDEKRSNKNSDVYFTITSPSGIEWTRQWQVNSKDEMENLLEDNRIYFGTSPDYSNVPRKKIFPFDEIEIIPPNLLQDKGTSKSAQNEIKELFDGKLLFDTPKPVPLIKHLLKIINNKSALILDFFAGSATTADAVMQLNAEDGGKRRYIMVQLPEPTFTTNSDGTEVARKGSEAAYQAGFRSIDEISRKRIELASQKIQSKEELTDFDGGFKHYRVVSPTQQTLDDLDAIDLSDSQQLSLLEEVDFSDMVTPFSATGLGYAGSARGEETILTTWLLADGYGFDAQTEQLNLAGYQATYLDRSRFYLISSGWTSEQTKALVNCLGTHELTLQTLVIYAYSFELESLRELELALNQLDSKPELLKRY